MEYIGLAAQQRRNNTLSAVLLICFPLLILLLVLAFNLIVFANPEYGGMPAAFQSFLQMAPYVVIGVGVWFLIAFGIHSSVINAAAGSTTLERKENMRVYNLVENLCIAQGMQMPKVNIIDDSALNAFASGINEKTYTVTLTKGIIDQLNDEELEGVIAHELMHIRNRDVRLLIISIVFVGILAFAAEFIFRVLIRSGGRSRGGKDKGGAVLFMLVALALALLGYFIATLFKFALSRKREYLADAGAAEMTRNPMALASALKKVSRNYKISGVKSAEVAELFLENRKEKSDGFSLGNMFQNLFATHPPIEKRIAFLEQI